MELTVYRQSSKQRPDGTIVYKGEDARPFVDNRIFFVADGLGGAAAIRHQQINLNLFEREKLMDTLFKGVYEEYDDERFVKYVTDSFFELFAVKDCYTENINNIKKSGYFASRIVTAILLHEMIYNRNFDPPKLFGESPEKKVAFANKLGNYFAKKIRDDLCKIAQNANLYYESSYSGLALLGTTLCATIYQEKNDSVEAFYLTAGDSRPYVWTEADGLCQILEDQEGKDGGMTNYIKANEGETFSIRCNYMQFKKPCVLFNASDGCFDSGYFLSQMAFEKLILDKAVESNDTASMSKSLHETFLTYGKHDDSSTIAMKFFGYESFLSFKKSASCRLEKIKRDYLSRLPDVLEHDYISEYEENLAKLPQQLSDIKQKFYKTESILTLSSEQMINEKYPPYESMIVNLEGKKSEAEQQKNRTLKAIEDIISRNYIRFITQQTPIDSWSEKRTISRIYNIKEKHQHESEDFVSLIEGYRSDFEKTTKQLKDIIEKIFDIDIPADFSDYDEIGISVIEECERSMEALFEFFNSIKNKKLEAIRKLTQLRKKYIEQNLKLATREKDKLPGICKNVISGSIDIEKIRSKILKDDFDNLKQELAKFKKAEDIISSIPEEVVKANKDSLATYWKENYVKIITSVVSNTSVSIPDDLRKEAKTIIDELQAQSVELKNKSELQSKLFQQYNASYGRYLGGNLE